jgi:hypothetical protein
MILFPEMPQAIREVTCSPKPAEQIIDGPAVELRLNSPTIIVDTTLVIAVEASLTLINTSRSVERILRLSLRFTRLTHCTASLPAGSASCKRRPEGTS